jgi:hypothetical protein
MRRPFRFVPTALAIGAGALLASCRTPPQRSALHYEARDATGWTRAGTGRWTAPAAGGALSVDLHPTELRLELRLENPTPGRLTVRLGPQTTRDPDAAIGELQHRRLDPARREGTTAFLPYLSMQAIDVEPGTAVTFWLDSPLGREPSIGQYFVLVVDVQGEGHAHARLMLPLQATNVPG